MLYSTEYQIMKYFSAMLCQNLVPQNKMKSWNKAKKCSHRILNGMFRLILLIYLAKYAKKKHLSKFMQDKLRDSIIVKLTENRFLQMVQKIELIKWDWSEIHYAAQRPYQGGSP